MSLMFLRSRPVKRFRSACLFLLCLLFVSLSPTHVGAQEQGDAYWTYDASGRVGWIETADIDLDGIEEVLLIGGQNGFAVLAADGAVQWQADTGGEPIVQIAVLNIIDEGVQKKQIAIGTRTELFLYDAQGGLVWEIALASAPIYMVPFDPNGDGAESILIAARNGRLQLYDPLEGDLVWNYVGDAEPPNIRNARPKLQVTDFEGDGQDDITLIYRSQRGFDRLIRVSELGELVWGLTLQDRAASVAVVNFSPVALAVGAENGRLLLFDGRSGGILWTRTQNRPISHMVEIEHEGSPALVVGTDEGMATAYSENGRSIWQVPYADTFGQGVSALLPVPQTENELLDNPAEFVLSLAGSAPGDAGSPETMVLDGLGRVLWREPTLYDNALTQLADLNRDGQVELLSVSFGNLRLQPIDLTPVGQSYTVNWRSRINAQPIELASLIPEDRRERLVVAGDDGRVHLVQLSSGAVLWQSELLGAIQHIATASTVLNGSGAILVGYNNDVGGRSELMLFDEAGTQIWENPYLLDESLSSVIFSDLNNVSPAEMLVGLDNGDLLALSTTGRELWRTSFNGRVRQIMSRADDSGLPSILAVTDNGNVTRLSHKGEIVAVATFGTPLQHVEWLDDGSLAVIGQNGVSSRVDPEFALQATQTLSLAEDTSQTILIDDVFLQIVSGSSLRFFRPDQSGTRTLLWEAQYRTEGELTFASVERSPDGRNYFILLGDSLGRLQIWNDQGRFLRELRLGSAVLLAQLTNQGNRGSLGSLLMATENGVLHRFDSQANRAPLLVNPQVEFSDGRYGVSIDIVELDRDNVTVSLLGFDDVLSEWRLLGERTAEFGDERLFWLVAPSPQVSRYQFSYDDGTFFGTIEPDARVFPEPNDENEQALWLLLLLFGLAGVFLFLRTDLYIGWRTQQVYRTLVANRSQTLAEVAHLYATSRRQPDRLLAFSSRARRDKKYNLARLLEGVYLFLDQPESGLRLLNNGLQRDDEAVSAWDDRFEWQQNIQVSLSLLSVPTLAELTALEEPLTALCDEDRLFADEFALLQRPLAGLAEAEKVMHAPDRLAYLYDSVIVLEQAQAENKRRPAGLFRDIVAVILTRWIGLVHVWIDDWRGRPWLSAALQTKRIVSADLVPVVLVINNSGQATAEHVSVALQENPDFSVINAEQTIPVISSGRSGQVTVQISPHTNDPFRLIFTVAYEDNQGRAHTFDFADMVHPLEADRPFRPIPNLYAPGTPLRQDSKLFVGREDLLQDVVEQVRQQKQSILVVVGQRRTGKTSTLLRLETVMPQHILPVYVDGQSLGILPGIGAFLHDVAWLISDALYLYHDQELAVPDIDIWERDPLNLFQRTFLPEVYGILPENGRVLLVFDEFEVFEDLVRDGIFPPTFFPFLRHLMQHSTQLSFVFAGTHRLEEIASDYWSVLFNLALYRQISYLSEPAAKSLVTEPVDGYLTYDDLALDRIWRATAGHPYFLQLVCYTMVAYANQKKVQYITISDVNASIKEMLQLGEVHFAYLWRESSFVEQVFLTAVAHLQPAGEPIDPYELMQKVKKYDFVFELNQVRQAFRLLEQRGIVQEVRHSGRLSYTMRIDLVRLWVEENRSFSRLREEQSAARALKDE